MVRKRVVVTGRVQQVAYRATCRRMAYAYAVTGWARNLADGSVEAVFEGPPEAVAALVAWAHQGPPYAQVTGVEVVDEDPEGLTGFAVA